MDFKKLSTTIYTILSLVFCIWWIYLALYIEPEGTLRHNYSLTYGILAGYGGILGFFISKRWGGFKSYVGKSLIFFAFGLFCQFLGQNAYSLKFLIDHIENSYPSYGEIFFFISMPSYILGVWYIAKAAGTGIALKSIKYRLISVLFPAMMVVISYYMFIHGSSMEGQSTIAILLNFAYPIGQAMFLSMAIMAYFLSGKILGGIMRRRVIFILFSLVFQYMADSIFLFKSINGTWYQGDVSEFMFAISYILMTYAFLDFSSVFVQLKDKS
ncbi:hypothetical protein HYV31_01925 [candidate division WWE3 bacterium]|nr:hypothetical protein [candidate division WWE3 bacterium]